MRPPFVPRDGGEEAQPRFSNGTRATHFSTRRCWAHLLPWLVQREQRVPVVAVWDWHCTPCLEAELCARVDFLDIARNQFSRSPPQKSLPLRIFEFVHQA